MGYYTSLELEILKGEDYEINYEFEIGSHFFSYDVKNVMSSFIPEMISYSKKHPNTLFLIKGDGEESFDMWKAYIKNGKMQFCEARIEYDDFNESLMIDHNEFRGRD